MTKETCCQLLKLSSPAPTAKHFILKTSKYNPACVSLVVVPADSPSLSPSLPHAIFSCPQDPLCSRLSPPPPLSLLFGSAAALEDAWHRGTVRTREDGTKGKWVQWMVGAPPMKWTKRWHHLDFLHWSLCQCVSWKRKGGGHHEKVISGNVEMQLFQA